MRVGKILKDVVRFQKAVPKAFLAYGTALGAIREGNVIDWDLDGDFYIFEKDFNDSIVDRLKVKGFKLTKKYGTDYGVQYVFHRNYKVDLWILYEGDKYYNCLWDGEPIRHEYPKEIINPINVNLGGHLVRGLGEDYLTHVYGDWQTPVKTFNWRTDHRCATGKSST